MHRTLSLAVLLASLLLASCASSAPPAAPAGAAPTALQPLADTLRYSILLSSRVAGTQKVWSAPDGGRMVRYEYNDRGRGPSILQRIAVGPEGTPTRVEVEGHDYFKNPVAERFTLAAARAEWRNTAENGQAELRQPAFYTSMDGAPEEGAVLARALLTAPGQQMALLPAGAARIERVEERTVQAEGRTQRVGHYEISGLGLTPIALWLDGEGELFAAGSSWWMVIREGWEAAQPELVAAQDARETERTQRLAAELARRPTGPLVFRGANLFDAETGRMRPGTTVVVNGNRITAVGPDGETAIPPGAEVIETAGRALLPGLWDMHVHLSDDEGLLHLAAGVTTVRDLANDTEETLERRRRFDAGTVLGPRLLVAGFMDGPGPYAGPTKVLVATEAEARQAVDSYADLGYPQIKIYSSIRPELVPAIIDQAHRRGLRVSGHVPAGMTAEELVRLGMDELQHANFLLLNFWGDEVRETQTPLRFTAVAERAALLDLDSERVQRFVRLLRERGTVVDPTVAVFEGMFTGRKGTISPGFAAIADRLPPQVRRNLLTGGLPVPEGMDQRYRDSYATMLRLVKMLHDAGVPIVAGTDGFAGFTLHRELELYVQAGIPAPEVLRIATLGAARVAKREAELGSIAPGKLADLILVEGNPAERIGDIRRVSLVVKDGIVLQPDALYGAVGIQPASVSGR